MGPIEQDLLCANHRARCRRQGRGGLVEVLVVVLDMELVGVACDRRGRIRDDAEFAHTRSLVADSQDCCALLVERSHWTVSGDRLPAIAVLLLQHHAHADDRLHVGCGHLHRHGEVVPDLLRRNRAVSTLSGCGRKVRVQRHAVRSWPRVQLLRGAVWGRRGCGAWRDHGDRDGITAGGHRAVLSQQESAVGQGSGGVGLAGDRLLALGVRIGLDDRGPRRARRTVLLQANSRLALCLQ